MALAAPRIVRCRQVQRFWPGAARSLKICTSFPVRQHIPNCNGSQRTKINPEISSSRHDGACENSVRTRLRPPLNPALSPSRLFLEELRVQGDQTASKPKTY